MGPGYIVEKQEIQVHFTPSPAPLLTVEAVYLLKNSGNRPLQEIEVRLPGPRRFHILSLSAQWDGAELPIEKSPDFARNSLVTLAQPWPISSRHTLRIRFEIQAARTGDAALSFASDAFFLPSEGWSPQLEPVRGAFGFGGVPPKQWALVTTVPSDFLLHTSGAGEKSSRRSTEIVVRTPQRFGDAYPFVIAGRYQSSRTTAAGKEIFVWTRQPNDAAHLRQATDSLAQVLQTYDAVFGSRGKAAHPFWIFECPVAESCFASHDSGYAKFLSDRGEEPSAEMASLDTVLISAPDSAARGLAAAAAPSLAASWLGYGRNPGFYEQEPPLTALPAYAAAVGRAAVEGPSVRAQIIRRALAAVPPRPSSPAAANTPEDPAALRAKSLLFFYGLEDRYGQEVFRAAISHMLHARSGRGFDVRDLISAFELETRQNVAEFVRVWMKHPGVPADFRARYENSEPSATTSAEETNP